MVLEWNSQEVFQIWLQWTCSCLRGIRPCGFDREKQFPRRIPTNSISIKCEISLTVDYRLSNLPVWYYFINIFIYTRRTETLHKSRFLKKKNIFRMQNQVLQKCWFFQISQFFMWPCKIIRFSCPHHTAHFSSLFFSSSLKKSCIRPVLMGWYQRSLQNPSDDLRRMNSTG